MAAKRATLEGRVQGVGFRYFVQQKSRNFDIAGWVRNLPSGEVEIHVEGEPGEVDRFLDAVREGPRTARVENVEVQDAEEKNLDGFSIRR